MGPSALTEAELPVHADLDRLRTAPVIIGGGQAHEPRSAMVWLIRAVIGVLLIAHGLVHLLYVSGEADDAGYAFTLKESWLVPVAVRHTIGVVLMAATVAAFALVGLAVWGVPFLSGNWPILTIVAATLSLMLLMAFFDFRLVFGIAIDLSLIALVIADPGWTEQIGA